MSRQTTSRVALLMLALAIFPGCSPTQPFYFHEDGDLSHYLDKATEMEYPDVCAEPLPDTTLSQAPLSVTNPDFKEIWDLTLEECIQIALQNSKVIRNLGGVTPITFSDGLVERTGTTTIYDKAILQTNPGTRNGRDTAKSGPTNYAVRGDNVPGVEAALSEFDALVTFGAGQEGRSIYDKIERPNNRFSDNPAAPFLATVQDQDAATVGAEIYKKSASGARYTFRNYTTYLRYDANSKPGSEQLNSYWSTSFEARIDYPLLRGRGTQITRMPIVLARINEDKSLAQFEAAVRNHVLDIENTYWDLHRWYRNLETAKTARDSAQGAWRIVYEKFNEGVAPAQEEAYAREQYFQFRAGVERSLQDLYTTETKLRWLMGLAATDGRLIRPIDEPTMARVEFDWCAIRTEALVRSPELRGQKWTVKQRELELISARNQLLPDLNVGAVYKWVGLGDQLFSSNGNGAGFPAAGSSALAEVAGGDYQEAAFFFDFALPVGFRLAMSSVRHAQLQCVREKAILEDQELNVVHLLSTAVRNVESHYVQAQTHFNRWSAAEKEVESATAKWKGGADTVDKVLDAQQRRAQAQLDFYTNLVEYNKAIAEVHFRKGSLLEYNNIELTEGNWPQKAYWDALALARQRDASYYLNYGWTRPDVISAGPVDQGMGGPMMGQPTPVEVVPTPEPTPAGPAPAEGPAAPELTPTPEPLTAPPEAPAPAPATGPITGGPSGPMLNAPLVRSAAGGQIGGALDNPLRGRPLERGEWGLNQLRSGAPATVQPGTNALRSGTPETASPVQPAGYSATISDAPGNRN